MNEIQCAGGAQSGGHLETDEPPSLAVIRAVADREGVDPLELPPLNDAVDADALDTLFTSAASDLQTRIRFEYAEYQVTVLSEGTVRVAG